MISRCVVDSEHISAQHLLTSGDVNVLGEADREVADWGAESRADNSAGS